MAYDIATTPAIERIARALAGREASANADGDETSAGDTVEAVWADYRADAVAVLKALREPDDAIAAVGDGSLWTRMVEAALGNETTDTPTLTPQVADGNLEVGSAPLIEGP